MSNKPIRFSDLTQKGKVLVINRKIRLIKATMGETDEYLDTIRPPDRVPPKNVPKSKPKKVRAPKKEKVLLTEAEKKAIFSARAKKAAATKKSKKDSRSALSQMLAPSLSAP